MSERQAMPILMTSVEALQIPADELVINRTTLQQIRQNYRQYQSTEVKSQFIYKVISLNLSI